MKVRQLIRDLLEANLDSEVYLCAATMTGACRYPISKVIALPHDITEMPDGELRPTPKVMLS